MAVANAEWWSGRRVRTKPDLSFKNRLKDCIGVMTVSIGRIVLNLVDPPYPTADGKPLKVHFYQPGESPFSPQQMEQLAAIVKMSEGKS